MVLLSFDMLTLFYKKVSLLSHSNGSFLVFMYNRTPVRIDEGTNSMPFTPYHVGPGIAAKAILQDHFSLVIFSATQVVMDLQPLVVMLTGRGETHGATHTLLGAAVLGVTSALAFRYPTRWLLNLFLPRTRPRVELSWMTAFFSALAGTFSHALIDALIYPDVELLWPLTTTNPLRIGFTTSQMITFCVASGVIGIILYVIIRLIRRANAGTSQPGQSPGE
jgi:membrane-bound metal-dependent hydrolase YbcI (DUF457 family)